MNNRQRRKSLIGALAGLGGRVVSAHQRRRTQHLIEHFPNRLLEDIGFERDWDGSVGRVAERS